MAFPELKSRDLISYLAVPTRSLVTAATERGSGPRLAGLEFSPSPWYPASRLVMLVTEVTKLVGRTWGPATLVERVVSLVSLESMAFGIWGAAAALGATPGRLLSPESDASSASTSSAMMTTGFGSNGSSSIEGLLSLSDDERASTDRRGRRVAKSRCRAAAATTSLPLLLWRNLSEILQYFISVFHLTRIS